MTAFTPGPYHVELASGRYLDLSNPDPATITLEDVAQGLTNTCRFAGQCEKFYSVAEHALLVASRLEDLGHAPAVCLAGLHHDDAEAFIGDVTQPMKLLLPEVAALEASVFTAVVEALGLARVPFDDPAVKAADAWMLAHEAHHLMPSQGRGWRTEGCYAPAPWPPLVMGVWAARREWLRWHRKLMAAHRRLTDACGVYWRDPFDQEKE